MLEKISSIGKVFTGEVHVLGAIVCILLMVAVLSLVFGSLLDFFTRVFFGSSWQLGHWMTVCFAGILVIAGLEIIAPSLAETISVAVKAAFYGALATGFVAWFSHLPWQTVAIWGGIIFFLFAIFMGIWSHKPSSSQTYMPGPFDSGVPEVDASRLNDKKLLRKVKS